MGKCRSITEKLSENDLRKTYREGAWNVRQLINHVADMQLLHFFRMKKALTEPDYKEVTLVDIPAWAETADGQYSPVTDSLDMMESITKRYVRLMRSLDSSQQQIEYYHPGRKMMLDQKAGNCDDCLAPKASPRAYPACAPLSAEFEMLLNHDA